MGLLDRFEKAEGKEEKKAIADSATMELLVHMQAEEELFYPPIRKRGGEAEEVIAEAEEEHHVTKLILGELTEIRPGEIRYDARFMVMSEGVKHHVEEEESQVFSLTREMGKERLARMGDEVMRRKEKLQGEMAGPARRRGAA